MFLWRHTGFHDGLNTEALLDPEDSELFENLTPMQIVVGAPGGASPSGTFCGYDGGSLEKAGSMMCFFLGRPS